MGQHLEGVAIELADGESKLLDVLRDALVHVCQAYSGRRPASTAQQEQWRPAHLRSTVASGNSGGPPRPRLKTVAKGNSGRPTHLRSTMASGNSGGPPRPTGQPWPGGTVEGCPIPGQPWPHPRSTMAPSQVNLGQREHRCRELQAACCTAVRCCAALDAESCYAKPLYQGMCRR